MRILRSYTRSRRNLTVAAREPEELEALASQSLLFVGGDVRVDGRRDADALRRIVETMGRLLQVKNLAVLMGAGASMHLGSPRIRGLSSDEVLDMARRVKDPLPPQDKELIEELCGADPVDLEGLLATLSLGIAFAGATASDLVHLKDQPVSLATVTSTRRTINLALARSCSLPDLDHTDEAHQGDPLRIHREFFRRLLRSRRGDLPRVRLFTTNYDLLAEQALDDSGIPYFDGFLGTVSRVFRPEVFEQDIYLPPGPDERRITRLPDIMYLYKLHGSINWRASSSGAGLGADVVVQTNRLSQESEDLALIYPTPHKEGDVLGYPYSELFRDFSVIVGAPETALLVVGYGFSDEHINRFIFQALAAVPTFQLFVVDPGAALFDQEPSPVATTAAEDEGSADRIQSDRPIKVATSLPGRLATFDDARVSVLAGAAARFENLATSIMPDPDELAEEDASAPLTARLSALLQGEADDSTTP